MEENKSLEIKDPTPTKQAEMPRDQAKKQKEQTKKLKKQGKKPNRHREPATPIQEPALPLLLCLVCFAISLLTLIIDRFIYPFGDELLAPVIISAVALILPSYLAIMISSSEKSPRAKLSELGLRKISADHIFFLIFTSLLMMTGSLLLTLALGGAENAARGITLFGTFIAGENEFTVSYPYLILTYALLPAVAEELLFRGVMFSRLSKVSFSFAAIVSTVLYALFGFSLGGVIQALFAGILTVFVLYTTGSLVGCMIVHFIFNVYRLFLESNVCAYFLSQSNRLLLFVTISLALLISVILFSTECLRIYRKRAKDIKEKREKSANKCESIISIMDSVRSTLAHTPTLVFTIIIAAIFTATVIINFITL